MAKRSPPIPPKEVPIIKKRLRMGDFQHVIAADYNTNQGRISEINTGRRHADIPAAP